MSTGPNFDHPFYSLVLCMLERSISRRAHEFWLGMAYISYKLKTLSISLSKMRKIQKQAHLKFPKYNFKKIPPQNSSYARDRTLCVYNLVYCFFFLNEQKRVSQRGIIALAHLNLNYVAWDHRSCLGLSMQAHHFNKSS